MPWANGIYKITLSTEKDASLSENDVMYAKNTSDVGEKNVNLNFSHKLVKVVMQIYDEKGNGISGAQVKNQQPADYRYAEPCGRNRGHNGCCRSGAPVRKQFEHNRPVPDHRDAFGSDAGKNHYDYL